MLSYKYYLNTVTRTVIKYTATVLSFYHKNISYRRRIKYRVPFLGNIRKLPYSTRFQDMG